MIDKLYILNRVTVTLLLCFIFSGFAYAQHWNKTYIEDRPTMLFCSIINVDDSYKIIGVTTGPINNLGKSIIGNINSIGDLTFYKAIEDSANSRNGFFWNSLIRTVDGRLAFTGYCFDTVATLLFGIADVNLDSVVIFKYYNPQASVFRGHSILQYDINTYYITGVITIDQLNNAHVVLIKVDSNGNSQWEHHYNEYKLDQANKIIKLPNGNLLLGAVRNTADIAPQWQSNTWLIEVDTGGVVKRQWFDPNDSTYVAEGLLQTQDGSFVYGGQKKYLQIGSTIAYTGCITKMDSFFVKQWIYNGGYRSTATGITDVLELSDGSIIGCGQKFSLENDTNVLYGWVVKLTSEGEVVWDRAYTGINASPVRNFLSDIDVLPDGSLIAVGQCQQSGHTPPQVGWFLKLDSNGCEIENCIMGIDAPKSPKGDINSQIQIYPNPFASDISIALTGEHVSTATYTITTLTGQTVYRQTESNLATGYTKMLDLNYLPNGVYCVEVSTGEGNVVQRVVKQ